MKWFSIKTNPAARYLPQVFSKDEQSLVYRCLHSAAKRTDNRGTSTGAINFEESTEFLRPEQEAILIELADIPDSFNLKTRQYAINQAIENNRMLSRKKAYRWAEGQALSDVEFTKWWKRLLPQSQAKRQAAVEALRKERIQNRKYSMPALSGVVGSFSRDANNQWARVAIDHPIKLKHVLPVLQRIDAAFKKALPERWALQKTFVDALDPRFVIEGTTFTTITVNKNYRTAEHRDAGDLSQGFSNIAVFSNGLPFSGGHLVLPEFNVEICLKPGDLLFVANHEYIHQNTAITQEHPEAERLSLVCYAREGFAFAGTLEYENLRAEFQKKNKKFASMWTSKQWYRFLHQRLGAGNATLVSKARKAGILNREIVLLASLHEKDPLLNIRKWQYLASIPLTSPQDLATLRALFSTQHFKTSRQDRWLRENSKEEGAKKVDAVYLHDGWGYAYCETESGAVRLDQNRFNVQSVGKLANFALPFEKLPRDVFEWLESHWESEQSVHLVRCPTGIAEAPYQYALTTLSKRELRTDPTLQRLLTKSSEQQRFNQSGGNLANRDTLPSLRHNSVLLDLGFAYFPKRQGKLTTDGEATVDSILLSSTQEREYLKEALAHWKRRAKNLGSEDFYTRYERVGNYLPPDRPLNPGEASLPWHWKVEPEAIHLRRHTWQPNKRNTKRLVRGKAVNLLLPSRAAATELSWASKYQSPLLLAAHVPPTATLGIWRLKNSKSDAAQACLSNGVTLWMFQALGTQVPIRKSDRNERVPLKVRKPAVLGHLQQSKLSTHPDTSLLAVQLRKQAITISTPFSRMQSAQHTHAMSTSPPRANVLAIGGPPASGKTTLMKQLFLLADDWELRKPSKLLLGYFSQKLNTWIIGIYDPAIGTFQGTDQLSMAVAPEFVDFVLKHAATPTNIIFEGARLFNVSTLTKVAASNANLAILSLVTSRSTRDDRHRRRRDTQTEQFKKRADSTVRNTIEHPALFANVVEALNDSAEDQAKLLKTIRQILQPMPPLSHPNKTVTASKLKNKRNAVADKNIRPITKTDFIRFLTNDTEDRFARVFVAKANAQNLWKDCLGYWQGDELCAAIITRHSIRIPKTANLSLLHTFSKHRKKGIGGALVQEALKSAILAGCVYFRVSSEINAVPFYQSLGMRFLGRQKTAWLSMSRINGDQFQNGLYDITDPHIARALHRRGRGRVIEIFAKPR